MISQIQPELDRERCEFKDKVSLPWLVWLRWLEHCPSDHSVAGFDSQSWYIPRLWVRFMVGTCTRRQPVCVSLLHWCFSRLKQWKNVPTLGLKIRYLLNCGVFYISYIHGLYIFGRPVVEVSVPVDSEVNLKLQNIMMLLRKCCNHPYLIEYPIDPVTQEFKVNII